MIKWNLPKMDTPGYLRRRREIAVLVDADPTLENIDAIIEYLLPYVEVPEGEDAKEALLDAPEIVYQRAVLELLGYHFGKVPDPKDEKSETL